MQTENKQYEISYLVRTETDKEAVIKGLKDAGAENITEGRLNEIKLAYPIKKQTSALFGYASFEASPEMMTSINSFFRFAEEVLRFLIVTPPPKKAEPRFSDKSRSESGVESGGVEETRQAGSEKLSSGLSPERKSEVDDKAFDEKLEEILTNTQDESK